MQYLMLDDGSKFPTLGLGLWKIDRTAAASMVDQAIEAGYRHLDSACDYGNEAETGEGIERALSKGFADGISYGSPASFGIPIIIPSTFDLPWSERCAI